MYLLMSPFISYPILQNDFDEMLNIIRLVFSRFVQEANEFGISEA